MLLADLGKLLTRAIKAVFFCISHFCHTGECRRPRSTVSRRPTVAPPQYTPGLWDVPSEYYPHQVQWRDDTHVVESKDFDEVNRGSAALTTAREVELVGQYSQYPEEVDDEFNLPVSLALVFLVVYIILGALIFTIWENWSFFEAFYFVSISMSTIGFGDFVPQDPVYMMATFIYLLFGLALTSMCINVIQEKLSATFQKAKVRIGTTIGLDVQSLVEDDVRPRTPKLDSAETHGQINRTGKGGHSGTSTPAESHRSVGQESPSSIRQNISAPHVHT